MKVNLNKWYLCDLDKERYVQLKEKSDWAGFQHVGLFFISLFFFGYLSYFFWGTWLGIIFLLIYGNIYSCSNPIWHETGHRTAFKTDLYNKIFYQIGSFMTNFDPTRWRWSHFNHHSHTLFTKDPYDFEIEIRKPTDLLFFASRIIPFGGFLYIHKLPHLETLQHALGITTHVMKDCIPKKQQNKCRLIARIHVLIWILIFTVSIIYQSWFPIIYIILPTFYGNTLFELFGLTQHAGLSNNIKDHRISTRTVILNPIFSFLYWHMEYHIEHHMFPMIPSYNLKKLHHLIKDDLPIPKKNLWNAYKEIIPAVIKQTKDPNYKINVILPAPKIN